MILIQKALGELGKLNPNRGWPKEMAKLGRLWPSAVNRDDTAALRDAYHPYMNDGGSHLASMSSSDLHIISQVKIQHLIGKLQHLEYLDLSHCENLESLPGEIRKVTSLKVLKLPHEIIWKEAKALYSEYLDAKFNSDLEEDDEVAGLEDIACLVNLKTLQISEQYDYLLQDLEELHIYSMSVTSWSPFRVLSQDATLSYRWCILRASDAGS